MRERDIGGLKVRVIGEEPSNQAQPTVVLLHGFGAPGTDLVPLAGEIAAPPGTRFVFPEAPIALPRELGAGRCWWMIDVMRLQMAIMTGRARDLSRDVPEGLAEAREQVVAMLTELTAQNPSAPLVLGGFSQGAMLACDIALRTKLPLAGIALLSGTLLCEDEWLAAMPSREGLPVFQSHGKDDPLLPYELAERLRNALVENGLPVTWVSFSGGHGIAPNVIERMGDFLISALTAPQGEEKS